MARQASDLNSLLASMDPRQQQQQLMQQYANQQRGQSMQQMQQQQGVNQAQIQALMAAVTPGPAFPQQQQQQPMPRSMPTQPPPASNQFNQMQQAQQMAAAMQAMQAQAQVQAMQQQQQQRAQPSFSQQQASAQHQQMSYASDPQLQQPTRPNQPSPAALVDYARRRIYVQQLQARRSACEKKMNELDAPIPEREQARLQGQRDEIEIKQLAQQIHHFEQTFGGNAAISGFMRNLPPSWHNQLQGAATQATLNMQQSLIPRQQQAMPPPPQPQGGSMQPPPGGGTPKVGGAELGRAPMQQQQQSSMGQPQPQQPMAIPALSPSQIGQLLNMLPPDQQIAQMISQMQQKANLPAPPAAVTLDGMEVHLGRLFKAILSQGGSDLVNRTPNGWANVATTLGAALHIGVDPVALQKMAMNLCQIHMTFLARFEVAWISNTIKRLTNPQPQQQQQQATPSPVPLQTSQLPGYPSPSLPNQTALPTLHDPAALQKLSMNNTQIEALMRSMHTHQQMPAVQLQQQQQQKPAQQAPAPQYRPIQPAPGMVAQGMPPQPPRMPLEQLEFIKVDGYEQERAYVQAEFNKAIIAGFNRAVPPAAVLAGCLTVRRSAWCAADGPDRRRQGSHRPSAGEYARSHQARHGVAATPVPRAQEGRCAKAHTPCASPGLACKALTTRAPVLCFPGRAAKVQDGHLYERYRVLEARPRLLGPRRAVGREHDQEPAPAAAATAAAAQHDVFLALAASACQSARRRRFGRRWLFDGSAHEWPGGAAGPQTGRPQAAANEEAEGPVAGLVPAGL
jgi:hypothetical protein